MPSLKEGQKVRFFTQVTQRTFFHVEDALSIGKFRLIAGTYTPGAGASKRVYCYVDVYPFLADMYGILSGKSHPRKAFSGSVVDGQVQSRTYAINAKSGDKPMVFIAIENGAGTKTKTGAITPAGGPKDKVNISLSLDKGREMAMTMLMVGQAWTAEKMRGLGWTVSGYDPYELSPGRSTPIDATQAEGVRASVDHPEIGGTGARDHLAASGLVLAGAKVTRVKNDSELIYGDGTSPGTDNDAERSAFKRFETSFGRRPVSKQELRDFHASSQSVVV